MSGPPAHAIIAAVIGTDRNMVVYFHGQCETTAYHCIGLFWLGKGSGFGVVSKALILKLK